MGAIIFFLLILTFIGLLLLPCLITLFWQSRPIVAFVTALILALIISIFFYVPFLLLSQWLGRIRKRKRDLATLKKDTFE